MAGRRRLHGIVIVGVVALALGLVAAPAALAVKAPGLASSSQYKAFIEYVKKMEDKSTTPTSTETKNSYEAKLTAKKTATAHKANALFKRAGEEAEAEADEAAKEQAERVRAKEGEALEELKLETNSKLERTEASFHGKFERLSTGHRNREKALKQQIAELRAQKAGAAPGTAKQQFQERIEEVSGEVAANRQDEISKRGELKSAIAKQRQGIEATAQAKATELGKAAEETVKKIDNHWNKQYLEKKAALNTTRENRLGYLESKLEQGRAAIAAMPTA